MADSIPIDPVLLEAQALQTNGAIALLGLPSSTRSHSLNNNISSSVSAAVSPARDAQNNITETQEEYEDRLTQITRKAPLNSRCTQLGLTVPKKASLIRLREELVKYWFPTSGTSAPCQSISRPNITAPSARSHHTGPQHLASSRVAVAPPPTTPTQTRLDAGPDASPLVHVPAFEDAGDSDEASLIRTFDVAGANAYELLGYEDDDDEEDNGYVDKDGDRDGVRSDEDESSEDEGREAFRRGIRIEAVKRAEGNRRAGGLKTQKAMVKAWDEFTGIALKDGKIDDHIVDEHALLLFIKYSAERPKRTRRGTPIPGTFVGASHLKKMFFGALRIRKEQDAAEQSLARRRPAVSIIVWDAIKNRMDEALERVRNGLVPNEDAPDIRANTFLSEVTDEQLERIGEGFLAHRQLRLAVFGHLSWTAQHASGNRGDDFRALKLAELQPYTMLHPNKQTAIPSVLGMQGEEKAGRRGMRTTVNPVYSVFIANACPRKCSLGAFAFYHHYLHDVKNITSTMDIDWSVNKSWRQVRVLHGPKSPTTPFNEQNLYNLYCRAYTHAGFSSKLKAHLPRHLLGYKQAALGVDPAETSKLGWVRGETYFDTYAPSLPKKAILAAAGYQADEQYDPVWHHVQVPEQFLLLVCPNAERIHEAISGKANLSGAANYWAMVISLRPYLFQCGAAIYQKCPKSAIFRLPALANADVIGWMKTTFPTQLCLLQAKAGSPVDLARIQNDSLRHALEEVRNIMTSQLIELAKLRTTVERRTAVLSPAQGFSASTYHRTSVVSSQIPPQPESPVTIHLDANFEETGTYETDESSFRAFVNSSPKTPRTPRVMTQVDLVLPPPAAFYKDDAPRGIWPPLLGQKSARWIDIFPLIQQPQMCWEVWGPEKGLDQFDVEEIWLFYVVGAPVFKSDGTQSGVKPPLQLVEQYFQARWRAHPDKKERGKIAKAWERFREIPEWIDVQSKRRGVSPAIIFLELETMRGEGAARKGINSLATHIAGLRKAEKQQQSVETLRNILETNMEPSASVMTLTNSTSEGSSTAPGLGPPFTLVSVPGSDLDTENCRKRARALDPRRPRKKSKA